MATQPPRRVLQPLVSPQHYVPPGARELRAQAVQRLQAGLFGMALIVLVVGLANVINDRARLAEAANKLPSAASPNATASVKSDPLADIGVVPSTAPEIAASPKSATGLPH